jgi:hypothetical protein
MASTFPSARGAAAASLCLRGPVPLQARRRLAASLPVLCRAAQGTHREVLRALCQLVNSTELTLEACLADVEDGDWHMVSARSGMPRVPAAARGGILRCSLHLPRAGIAPIQRPTPFPRACHAWGVPYGALLTPVLPIPPVICAGSLSATFSADSVEEEVFENERFARGPPGGGSQWAAANLRRGDDPARFQYALRQADSFPRVRRCRRPAATPGHVRQPALAPVLCL